MFDKSGDFMTISEFDFGEVIKVFAGTSESPQIFIGQLHAKMGTSALLCNVVHINTSLKYGKTVIDVNFDSKCFDIPSEVELSDWMDSISNCEIKYLGNLC